MEGFEEFTTPMQELGITLHEMFESIVKAGFTEKQALYLVGQAVRGSANPTPADD